MNNIIVAIWLKVVSTSNVTVTWVLWCVSKLSWVIAKRQKIWGMRNTNPCCELIVVNCKKCFLQTLKNVVTDKNRVHKFKHFNHLREVPVSRDFGIAFTSILWLLNVVPSNDELLESFEWHYWQWNKVTQMVPLNLTRFTFLRGICQIVNGSSIFDVNSR